MRNPIKVDKVEDVSKSAEENILTPENDPIKGRSFGKSTKDKKSFGSFNGKSTTPFRTPTNSRIMDIDSYNEYINKSSKGEDFGFPYQANLDYTRALNQSGGEQTMNAIGRTALKIIPELIGMVGNTLDFEDYKNSDDEVGNALHSWSKSIQEQVDEKLPIYRTDPTKPLDVADYGWWMQSGSELVKSAGAFVALGYMTGGASLAALKNGGKALEFLGFLSKATRATDTVKKATQVTGTLMSTLMLNQAEGLGIAVNVYDEAYNETYAKLLEENPNADPNALDQQAKEVAATKASNAILYNRANILLNLTSAHALMKAPKLTRANYKPTSLTNSVKRTLLEGGQESLEETVNMLSENAALDDTYSVSKAMDDIFSREGAENAFLGFMGGAIQTSFTNAGRGLKLYKDENGKRVSQNDLQNARYAAFEQQKAFYDSMSQSKKLSNLTDTYMKSKEVAELYTELQDAIDKKDTKKVAEIKNMLLYNQAYDAFTTGSTESLLNVHEGIKNLSPEQAEERGLDKETYKQQAESAIDLITKLEKEYNNADGYLDSFRVYESRAKRILKQRDLKDIQKEKESALNDFNDIVESLGFNEGDVTIDEAGNISIDNKKVNYRQEEFDVLKNSDDYNYYAYLIGLEKTLKDDIKGHETDYLKFTSDNYQKSFKAKIEKEIAQEKAKKREAEIAKKQRERKTKSEQTKKGFQEAVNEEEATEDTVAEDVTEETPPSNTTGETTPTPQEAEEVIGRFNYKTNDEEAKEARVFDNEVFKSPKYTTESKIKLFNKRIEEFTNANIDEDTKASAILQYNQAIQELADIDAKEKAQKAAQRIVDEKAQRELDSLGELLENTTPLDEDTSQSPLGAQELQKRIDAFNRTMVALEAAGINIRSFVDVARYAQNSLGAERFNKMFDSFKDLYNLTATGDVRVTLNYEDIFYSKEEKERIIKNEKDIIISTILSDLYSLSDLDYELAVNNNFKDYLTKEGYLIYKNDTIKIDGALLKNVVNTIAHLDKRYKTDVKVKTRGFNILSFMLKRSDINTLLNNNISQELLDFNQVNVGSKISFKVLDQVIYDDGTIVKSDGTVIRNGVETKEDPSEVAPIAIVYDNKVLKGSFLHVPSWINIENTAIDNEGTLEQQRQQLRDLRQFILNSPVPVETVVTQRSNGHMMFNPDGTLNTVKENLPSAKIAVGKDSQLFVGKDKVFNTGLNPNHILNGIPYVIFPVNKGTFYANPIHPVSLNTRPEVVNTIKKLVRIYIDNNADNEIAKDIKNKTGIDVTTTEGLRKILSQYIYLKSDMPIQFSDFISIVEQADELLSVFRIVQDPNNPKNDSFEFGIGANRGSTISNINRNILNSIKNDLGQPDAKKRENTIKVILDKLDKTLKNGRFNVNKNLLGQNFNHIIINDKNEVVVETLNYTEFIKENTQTPQYSVKMEDGTDIYTIQSTISFDTEFVNQKPKVVDNTEATIVGNNQNNIKAKKADIEKRRQLENTQTPTQKENYQFNIDDDLDIDDISMSPLSIDNQINYTLKSINILQSSKAEEIFAKGQKNGWSLDKILTELQIPKEQKQLILDLQNPNIARLNKGQYNPNLSLREQLALELAANYSYTVEVNTAKTTQGSKREINNINENTGNFILDNNTYSYIIDKGNAEYFKDNVPINLTEYEKALNNYTAIPTQYYSTLTVPGGTNYTENEISTPLIIPSIKGHAQFSTDKGIGWFRSDDKADGQNLISKEEQDALLAEARDIGSPEMLESVLGKGTPTKTRRILEVQSDLFQKGRDKKDLVKYGYDSEFLKRGNFFSYDGTQYDKFPKGDYKKYLGNGNWEIITEKEYFDAKSKAEIEPNSNKFLQLLNKDSNWVTFFIKSIIQDSAKKGYEKVLFPTGDTASKVEGHTTLEEFKKQKEDRLKEIENTTFEKTYKVATLNEDAHTGGEYKTKEEAERFLNNLSENIRKDYKVVLTEPFRDKENLEREKAQLKQELERVETEGFAALRPIYNFYENTVTNILKKQGYNSKLIKDEYGNTWNEIDINDNYLNDISLSPKFNIPTLNFNNKYVGDLDSSPVYSEKGVNIMRTSGRLYEFAHYGNPFTADPELAKKYNLILKDSVPEAAKAYKDWLLGNTNFEFIEEIENRKATLNSNPDYIIISNLPKITPESAKKETGGKVGTNQDINPSYLSKNGVSVEKAAELIYQDHFSENNQVDEAYIRDTIIDILSKTKSDYIKSLTGEDRLTNIDDYSNVNPQQREWILNEIESGKLNNATLLYPKSLIERPEAIGVSHGHALIEVVKLFAPNTVNRDNIKSENKPKDLTLQFMKEMAKNTPASLSIQGVSIPIQNIIINHLSQKIVKDLVANKYEKNTFNRSLTEFREFVRNGVIAKLEQAITSNPENASKYANKLELYKNIDRQFNIFRTLIIDRLRTYNNIVISNDSIQLLEEFSEIDENFDEVDLEITSEDTKEDIKGDSEIQFQQDNKDKISTKLKNLLSYVEDVSEIRIENGNEIAIPKKTGFLNINNVLSFDYIINELNGILAYDNFQEQNVHPDFNKMIKILESWKSTKPFIYNIIKELEKAPDNLKSEFVKVMSKHYTNHVYLYTDRYGNIKVGNSDSNNVAKVIKNKWYQNIIDSNIVKLIDNKYILDSEVIDNLQKRYKILIKGLENSKDYDYDKIMSYAFEFFKDIGINIPLETLKDINENTINIKGVPHTLIHLLKNSNGAIKVYMDYLNDYKNKDIESRHPFSNNSAIGNFASALAKKNPVYFANSFRDVRNRLYFSYSNMKFFISRIKDLKENNNLIQRLSNNPYSKSSTWLKQLVENKDKFSNIFEYFTVDGLKIPSNGNSSIGKKLDKLSPSEYEAVKVALFFNHQKGQDYIINLFYPTLSNKAVQYGLKTLGKKWSNDLIQNNNNTKSLSDSSIDELFNIIIQPEIDRIKYLQNQKNVNIKGFREGGTAFRHIPTLNSIKELFIEGTHELVADIETNERLKILMKKELENFLQLLISNKMNKWRELELTTKSEDFIWIGDKQKARTTTVLKHNNQPLLDAATDFVLNYLVGNINVYQTFTTDPAFYFKSNVLKDVKKRVISQNLLPDINEENITRTMITPFYTAQDWINEHNDLFNNMGKRLAGDNAPGTDYDENNTSTINIGILPDVERPSLFLDYYKSLLKNKSKDYEGLNTTDAQAFTTFKEHLYLMNKEGAITKKKMRILLKKEDKGTLSSEDFKIVFNPYKNVYVNNIVNDQNIEHRLYIKYSSFPLIKQLTQGLEIDNFRQAMISNNLDMVAFDSAIKVGGTVNPVPLFDSTGKINPKMTITKLNDGNPIPRRGLRKQQDMPFKQTQFSNDATQQRKLLTGNLRFIDGFKVRNYNNTFTGQKIQDKIDEVYHKLFKLQYDKLVEELQYDIYNNTINPKKVSDILKQEALTRKYPINDIESLSTENGEFIAPLWALGSASKIEAMLNSIVDNRIRKIKRNGTSFILGTSTGFKPVLEGDAATEYIKNNTNIIFDKDWANDMKEHGGTLRPMRVVNGVVQPAEVIISNNIKDMKGNIIDITKFVDENGFMDMTKLPKELFEIFGYRIPTQDLVSMAYIKIVGIMPSNTGDLMLAPSEWTAKMGSDFDIDKLYSFLYNTYYDKESNSYKIYDNSDDKQGLENQLLDLQLSVLKNNNEEVQKEISSPLTFGKLIDKSAKTDLLREISELIQNPLINKGVGISEEYQTFKYQNARSSAIAIGTFSLDSTFNAVIQNKNIYLRYEYNKKLIPFTFKLDNKKSTKLSNPKTTDGNLKSQVIRAFQSLAVDDENEQGLDKLHINSYTLDAIRTLSLSGFEEDVIIYFINQPIIRKYVELKRKEEDSYTNYSMDDLNKDIQILFPTTKTTSELFKDFRNPSLESLKEMIERRSSLTEDQKSTQREILNLFEKLSEYGIIIKNIQSTINTDSAGIGKDLFYSYEKEAQVKSLNNKLNIANVDKLVGEYAKLTQKSIFNTSPNSTNITDARAKEIFNIWFESDLSNDAKKALLEELKDLGYMPVNTVYRGEIQNTIEIIKPNTISGFVSVYGLTLNNAIWNRYFPYNNASVKSIQESVKSLNSTKEKTIQEKANENKKIFDNIKKALSSNALSILSNSTNLYQERQRLFFDTESTTLEDGTVIPANVSIAKIFKDNVENKIINNAFANRLEFEINKGIIPSKVIYRASLAENKDERVVYTALQDMLLDTTPIGTYNGIDYTIQKLAQDFITSELIQNGSQSYDNSIKYLPFNYLKTLGYYNYLKSINFNNEDDFNTEAFLNQYIQHNPYRVKINIDKYLDVENPSIKFYNNKTAIKVLNKDITLPRIFSIFNIADNNYSLYKYDFNSNTYKQIDTLGVGNYSEYDLSKPINNSNILRNKTPEVVVVDLPSEEELESFLSLDKKQPDDDSAIIYNPNVTEIENYYGIKNSENSIEKIKNILTTIITDNRNKLRTAFAKELLANIDKIKDVSFIIDNTIGAEGLYSLKNNTIRINVNSFNGNKDAFEETFIEEVIHAATKKAIRENSNNVVLKLKALRQEAENIVREKFGNSFDIKVAQVKRKLEKGLPLNKVELDFIYPVIFDDEFVGRLFRSKELQKLLNIKSKEKGGSLIESFYNFFVDILKSIGIDITKDSILDYSLRNIIELLNNGKTPPSSITGNLKTRSVQEVNAIYDLLTKAGKPRKLSNADKVAEQINSTFENITATVKDGRVYLDDSNQTSLLDDFNLSPFMEEEVEEPINYTKSSKLNRVLTNINSRLRSLEESIDKATKNKDFERVAILNEQLSTLLETRNMLVTKSRLRELEDIGKRDIEEIETMFKRKLSMEDIFYIRKIINNWKTAIDSMFESDDKDSIVLVSIFKDIEASMVAYEDKINNIETQFIEELMKDYDFNKSIEDIFKDFKDINKPKAYTLDLSHTNNDMLQALFLKIKEANIKSIQEAKSILKDLDSKVAKVEPILNRFDSKNPYDIFRQKTKKGKYTGKLLEKYSYDYTKKKNRLVYALKDNRNFANYNSIVEWSRRENENINLHYLFPVKPLSAEEQVEANNYINELKDRLGEVTYNNFYEKQSKLIKNYNERLKGYLEFLMKEYDIDEVTELLSYPEIKSRYSNWLLVNSPYSFYDHVIKGTDENVSNFNNFRSTDYVEFVTSKDENLDKDFEIIENNEDLLEFYNYYKEIDALLKGFLSLKDRKNLTIGGIPYVQRTLLDAYSEKGMKAGLLPFWDAIKREVSTTPDGLVDSTYYDPVTAEEQRELRINIIKDNSKEINDYIVRKKIEYLSNNPNVAEIPNSLFVEWREEIVDVLAQKQSYDLPKILKIYALVASAYKHKSEVEDYIKAANNILDRQTEYVRTSNNIIKTDEQGEYKNLPASSSYLNTKTQLDYYTNAFYGRTKKLEGKTNTKVYTSEDKQKLQEIDDLQLSLDIKYNAGTIEEDFYNEQSSELSLQRDSIGEVAVWSKRGDAILKYVQLKGMGWNVMSSIANIGFGFIDNMIEGAGGQLYDRKQLRTGYLMAKDSILKNMTFNKVETEEAKKIRNLMERFNILKTATKELFENPLSLPFNKTAKWLSPYNLTERTEYMNQAPIMIATMLNTKVQTDKGLVSLWEAFNSDGNWKEEYGAEPTSDIMKYNIKIDQLIKSNHGNYDPDSPLAIKEVWAGRAVSQFRSWMFEGVSKRFEGRRKDRALGIERRGRYLSLWDFFTKEASFLEASQAFSKGLLKELTFGLMFKKADFSEFQNEKFNETDVSNMRRVMAEILLLTEIYIAYGLLTALAAGLDDEDDKFSVYMVNNMINQGLRLKADILLYSNPNEFRNILRDLVPASSLIRDFGDLVDAVIRMSKGEDEIESGVYSGHSRLLRELAQSLPLGTQLYKNINYSIQTFDKK